MPDRRRRIAIGALAGGLAVLGAGITATKAVDRSAFDRPRPVVHEDAADATTTTFEVLIPLTTASTTSAPTPTTSAPTSTPATASTTATSAATIPSAAASTTATSVTTVTTVATVGASTTPSVTVPSTTAGHEDDGHDGRNDGDDGGGHGGDDDRSGPGNGDHGGSGHDDGSSRSAATRETDAVGASRPAKPDGDACRARRLGCASTLAHLVHRHVPRPVSPSGMLGAMELLWLGPGDEGEVLRASHLFDDAVDEAWARRFLEQPNHHLGLAVREGRPAGFVSGVEMTHPDKGTEMFLYELGVDDAHRGHGIGTALVHGAASTGPAARGATACGCWTSRDNVAALATYRATGPDEESDEVLLGWRFDR